MASQPPTSAYIIAARRTALGRIGGLHRTRRIEDLAGPVVRAVCEDGGIKPDEIDDIIVGNATAGGNPARIIALASGLSETVNATTVDQQDASGLVAIIQAVRAVAHGDSQVAIAGGAESLSTAPWRIARPRNIHQMPHFISPEPFGDDDIRCAVPIEGTEQLAQSLNISRSRQDAFATRSIDRALAARKSRKFIDEIVPLRGRPEEARDQTTIECDFEALQSELPFREDDGTLKPANTSSWHDGAAFVLVVSEQRWKALGQPPAMRLVANAASGVPAGHEAKAPIAAVEKLYTRLNGFDRSTIGIIETSESSAAQAIALADSLGLEETQINPDGGAIARGHPFGAAGALVVVRLFSQLVRTTDAASPQFGVATQGAVGGLGVAALFSRGSAADAATA